MAGFMTKPEETRTWILYEVFPRWPLWRNLRRRPLYPTELRGLIQKIFNFAELQDSNDSIFRRRTLYPTELLARISNEIVNSEDRTTGVCSIQPSCRAAGAGAKCIAPHCGGTVNGQKNWNNRNLLSAFFANLVGLSNMFDKPTMITTLTGGDSNAERSVLPQRLSH